MARPRISRGNRRGTYLHGSAKKKESGKEESEGISYNQLYAALAERTGMRPKDVNELSIAQVEGLLEGMADNNNVDGYDGKSSGSSNKLEDSDALRYLLDNGGI